MSKYDMAFAGDLELVGAVQQACRRRAAEVHQEIKRGIYSLATITSVAPWLGVFGTVVGILTSFRGGGGERTAMMAWGAYYLAIAVVSSAIGLFTALLSQSLYRYLMGALEAFDRDMEDAPALLLQRFQTFR